MVRETETSSAHVLSLVLVQVLLVPELNLGEESRGLAGS